MSKKSTSTSGIGSLLAILFIALKLLGKITWSWWWVLSPLWLPALVVLVVLALIAAAAAVAR